MLFTEMERRSKDCGEYQSLVSRKYLYFSLVRILFVDATGDPRVNEKRKRAVFARAGLELSSARPSFRDDCDCKRREIDKMRRTPTSSLPPSIDHGRGGRRANGRHQRAISRSLYTIAARVVRQGASRLLFCQLFSCLLRFDDTVKTRLGVP